MIKPRSYITEAINIVTGAQGGGKTLFAIEQADILRQSGQAKQVYQLGINEPDLRHLPLLPFPLEEWADRADAGELEECVILVDEFHEFMPERSQSKPVPKFIEQMAQSRKRGVRWILITQSTQFDHFLKGARTNRHFHLERKLGLNRSVIYEWQNRFVNNVTENREARKEAMRHSWSHPVRKYGHWYVSAKSHHFRIRLPWRIWAAILFLPLAAYIAYNAVSTVGELTSPGGGLIAGAMNSAGAVEGDVYQVASKKDIPVTEDLLAYMRPRLPLDPAMPWSAPVFQARPVAAEPELFCGIQGAGESAQGVWEEASCRCYTEQNTRMQIDDARCRDIVANGTYNPHRAPVRDSHARGEGGEPDGKRSVTARPAAPPAAVGIGQPGQVAQYGQFRNESPGPTHYTAQGW